MGAIVSTLAFPVPDRDYSASALLQQGQRLVWLTLPSSSSDATNEEEIKVPALHIQRSQRNPMTILYSHGNAEDVGISIRYLELLSRRLCINVLAYEYPGYSISANSSSSETNKNDKPSEELCCLAIRAAYEYLVGNCHVDPGSIVLLGRSLGTGPTVDLASTLRLEQQTQKEQQNGDEYPTIAGVILQSPLESGIRCVVGPCTSLTLYPLDIFRNYAKIGNIDTPVLILHGEKDKVVPCSNGKNLYATLQERPNHSQVAYDPVWIPGHGHNDLPMEECFQHYIKFIKFLKEQ